MEGTIPITHIRLIYDDDDSEDGIDLIVVIKKLIKFFVLQNHTQSMQFLCLWMTDYMMVSSLQYILYS